MLPTADPSLLVVHHGNDAEQPAISQQLEAALWRDGAAMQSNWGRHEGKG